MNKDIQVYLDDIIDSCDRIAQYIEGVDAERFISDVELQDAVVRRMEIIGEAVKRLPDSLRDKHPDIAWKEAAGMRDVLIHAYDTVDPSIVWRTAKDVLPAFKDQIRGLSA